MAEKFVLPVLALILTCTCFARGDTARTLVGWGIPNRGMERFVADAAEVGFDVLIYGSNDPKMLAQAVKAGQKHNIKIFSCITPMGLVKKLWTQKHPERPIPWQKMNGAEEAAKTFIGAGSNRSLIPYQWGGEPLLENEVLLTSIVCFSDPDARELFKPVIDKLADVPDLEGIAFDGFGYQNYNCCRCEQCEALKAEYMEEHPEVPAEQAEIAFFRQTLVNYINYLADYARSRNGQIKTAIHVWPVFAPDPLYGNLLDVDYCGQTAAWYTIWSPEKIASYSQIISSEAQKYHQRQQGVGMIGYYDRPGVFPLKDAERVDLELQIMLENGCQRIQVCSSLDVVKKQDIAEVFRKYFK